MEARVKDALCQHAALRTIGPRIASIFCRMRRFVDAVITALRLRPWNSAPPTQHHHHLMRRAANQDDCQLQEDRPGSHLAMLQLRGIDATHVPHVATTRSSCTDRAATTCRLGVFTLTTRTVDQAPCTALRLIHSVPTFGACVVLRICQRMADRGPPRMHPGMLANRTH